MLQVKSFECTPIQENTYILYNEFNECIIIDPGCYHDEEKAAFRSILILELTDTIDKFLMLMKWEMKNPHF